jgi:NitT/TauT family transport system permease protein
MAMAESALKDRKMGGSVLEYPSAVMRRLIGGLNKIVLPGISLVVLCGLWEAAALIFGARYLPGPVPTAARLAQLFATDQVVGNLAPTILRVLGGFAVAEVLGVILGVIMGLSRSWEKFLELGVMVGLTIPSLCYIILSFLWFGLNELAAIVAIGLTTFPIIAINVWSGVKSIDGQLNDMAWTFGISRGERIAKVIAPQITPYIVAAARYGFGVAWKVTIFVELMGLTNGVGFQLNYSFQIFDMASVFAWTLLFTIVMLILELAVFKPTEQWLFRWRPEIRA